MQKGKGTRLAPRLWYRGRVNSQYERCPLSTVLFVGQPNVHVICGIEGVLQLYFRPHTLQGWPLIYGGILLFATVLKSVWDLLLSRQDSRLYGTNGAWQSLTAQVWIGHLLQSWRRPGPGSVGKRWSLLVGEYHCSQFLTTSSTRTIFCNSHIETITLRLQQTHWRPD